MGPRNDQSAVDNYPQSSQKYWVIHGVSKGYRAYYPELFVSKASAIAEAEKRALRDPGSVFYVLEAVESVTVVDPIIRTQL